MSRIEEANVETERQAKILQEAEQVSLLLGRVRVNATEMRLSFANLDNDDLLRKVKQDVTAAQGRLDTIMQLESHPEDQAVFQKLKTKLNDIATAVTDINKSQNVQLNAVDSRPAIAMRARTTFSTLAKQMTDMDQPEAARSVQSLENPARQYQPRLGHLHP